MYKYNTSYKCINGLAQHMEAHVYKIENRTKW